jgi:hypothetical protein
LQLSLLCYPNMKICLGAGPLGRVYQSLGYSLHLGQRQYFSVRSVFRQDGPGTLRFPGALEAKFRTNMVFENPKDKEVIPCYRVMDSEGVIVDMSYTRDTTDSEAVKLYTNMLGVSIMDLICIDAQRQGKQIVSTGFVPY